MLQQIGDEDDGSSVHVYIRCLRADLFGRGRLGLLEVLLDTLFDFISRPEPSYFLGSFKHSMHGALNRKCLSRVVESCPYYLSRAINCPTISSAEGGLCPTTTIP